MGNTINRQNKRKLKNVNEQKILRNVWAGIGDSPQYHGNVFFLEFCKSYPQYTKYFTLDPEMPLTIDVHITMHFSIIMETMGYLMVDYYKNRKQHDYFIGYVAMVHKDMNLIRRDMSNFAVALIEYLSVTFPTIMTPDNYIIVSAYISNVCENISKNIEDLKKMEFSDNIKLALQKNSPFVRWISCHENSVYGKTVDFWSERKLVWETRLEEWKRRTRMTGESRRKSSSTDDDVTSTQSSNDENDTSQSTQPSRIYESSTTSGQSLTPDNAELMTHEPSVMLRTKKPGETEYNIVETIDRTNQKLGSDSEFEFLCQDNTSLSSNNYHGMLNKSSSQTVNNMRIDSIARKRRRERLSV